MSTCSKTARELAPKTGWPPGMMQDDSRKLFDWFASRPDARRLVRESAAAIGAAL